MSQEKPPRVQGEPRESGVGSGSGTNSLARPLVDDLFRSEYGKLVAVLTAQFGFRQVDTAEDLVQETLLAAMADWGFRGVPEQPAAWLMAVAKNKAKNLLRSQSRKRKALAELVATEAPPSSRGPHQPSPFFEKEVEDAQLRMIIACCHPAIGVADQIALILKTQCGFGPKEIASSLMVSETAIKKRITRAKAQIRTRGLTLDIPTGGQLERRLHATCGSLYLLFNEGYYSVGSEGLLREDLCAEAIRMTSLLVDQFSEMPQLPALLALMLFHAARFPARQSSDGQLVLLQHQDRTQWNQPMLQRALLLLADSARGSELSRYHLEASIAAQYCLAPRFEDTNWPLLLTLYERLYQLQPNPVVRLNQLIVKSMHTGPLAALDELTPLVERGPLSNHPLALLTLGEFLRVTGSVAEARAQMERALSHSHTARERAFVTAKLAQLSK